MFLLPVVAASTHTCPPPPVFPAETGVSSDCVSVVCQVRMVGERHHPGQTGSERLSGNWCGYPCVSEAA